MAAAPIEPGLLRVFQGFVAFRLGVLMLVQLSLESRTETELLLVPRPGIVVYGFLLVYLLATPLQEALGRAYLAIGITVATISPILENAIAVGRRVERGAAANAAVADYWLLVFVLFVPLILVAWQYRFRVVVVYAVATTVLDAVVLSPQLTQSGAVPRLVGALLVGRGVLFAFVGGFITKLVARQRAQRTALARHASTLEQLATSRERNRLARELHDTLAHTLSAVAVQLEGAKSLWDDDPERARAMVERSLDGTRSGLSEARRAIQALRASPLDELGFVAALEQLGAAHHESSAVQVEMVFDGDLGDLDPDVEQAAYRIVDEGLVNVVRHAAATTARVEIARRGHVVSVRVVDDGSGFAPGAAEHSDRHGLRGMRERAEMVGGRLLVESREGAGTTVELQVPVA